MSSNAEIGCALSQQREGPPKKMATLHVGSATQAL